MRFSSSAKSLFSSIALLSLTAYAGEENQPYYAVEGSNTVVIPINEPANGTLAVNDLESLSGVKTITLMEIKPSNSLLNTNMENRRVAVADDELDYSKEIKPFKDTSESTDIGMENVPVLDQGKHGTCVTFASTAALDARFKLGDYIDQQCVLALAKEQGQNYWNGARTPSQIIGQLKDHGFVKKGDCFNKNYPNLDQKVSVKDYESISNKSHTNAIELTYKRATSTAVNNIKEALKKGHRVLFGTYLLANSADPISISGFGMNVNGTRTKGGLWACKQPGNTTNYCPNPFLLHAGHEILITGFDDKQQLFKIRNSWGPSVGDKGDFYMTYTFFDAMAIDYTIVN